MTSHDKDFIMPFEASFIQFIESVTHKDFDCFKSFLDPGENILVIKPHGEVIDTVDKLIKAEEKWFASHEGDFQYEIKMLKQEGQIGFATIEVELANWFDGETIHIQISFLFVQKSEKWFLHYVQNTILQKP